MRGLPAVVLLQAGLLLAAGLLGQRAGLSGSGTAVGSGSSTWPPHQPATREELFDVPGIGEKKADAYGAAFLAAIADYEASVR